MNIAFVLLTHNPDEPAGIERSIASLADGLRELGHRALIVAAGPAHPADDPDLLRLTSLALPRPVQYDEVMRLLAEPAAVDREVRDLLTAHRVDLVCWVDAGAGLGFLNPAPPGVRTALMVHFLRTDDAMHESLKHQPGVVLPVSDFLTGEAARAGLDTTGWQALPNALLHHSAPPTAEERERLRRTGPVRTLSRADPQKGVAELLRAYPAEGLGRPVQIVLAAAGFEFWPGMQEQVISECRALAAGLPDVEILPALPWQEVQPFLAGAAVTVMGSNAPETFGNVAAESLSVGTPVVGYGLGHLPVLTGGAGRMVELEQGPEGIWRALRELVDDPEAYHAAVGQAPRQVADQTPVAVARAFLRAAAPDAV
ncbi:MULTISPECIES: glycosyltransferase family 4 protein [unclassified Kitasatospora]|uniref:glycosyltransferase family 4 protein n=1 Tax=unclassified Kitasatospora TaxID=2633591 RepID=UPI003819239C